MLSHLYSRSLIGPVLLYSGTFFSKGYSFVSYEKMVKAPSFAVTSAAIASLEVTRACNKSSWQHAVLLADWDKEDQFKQINYGCPGYATHALGLCPRAWDGIYHTYRGWTHKIPYFSFFFSTMRSQIREMSNFFISWTSWPLTRSSNIHSLHAWYESIS